jgi:hypothetical protein
MFTDHRISSWQVLCWATVADSCRHEFHSGLKAKKTQQRTFASGKNGEVSKNTVLYDPLLVFLKFYEIWTGQRPEIFVRFQILTAASMKMTVFWDIAR